MALRRSGVRITEAPVYARAGSAKRRLSRRSLSEGGLWGGAHVSPGTTPLSTESCNKGLFGMFNRRSEVMKQFSILALCLILVLAITTSVVEGQMNVPVAQNGSHAAGNGRSHATSARPNASVVQNIARGPANFGSRTINSYPTQIAGQRTVNFRPNYSQFMRPLSPTLAAMSARHVAHLDNVQPNRDALPRSEIAQATVPIANAQRVVTADNLKPFSGDLATRDSSEGQETLDTKGIARNNN